MYNASLLVYKCIYFWKATVNPTRCPSWALLTESHLQQLQTPHRYFLQHRGERFQRKQKKVNFTRAYLPLWTIEPGTQSKRKKRVEFVFALLLAPFFFLCTQQTLCVRKNIKSLVGRLEFRTHFVQGLTAILFFKMYHQHRLNQPLRQSQVEILRVFKCCSCEGTHENLLETPCIFVNSVGTWFQKDTRNPFLQFSYSWLKLVLWSHKKYLLTL